MKTGASRGSAAAPAPVPDLQRVHEDVARYYTQKVLVHGATAAGADWACEPTQQLRFVQLLKLCDFGRAFSLNDVGCGYGALLRFMARRYRRLELDYLGIDLSQAMIDQTRPSRRPSIRSHFVVGGTIPRVADYCVASGIFNVKLKQSAARWTLFIEQTLAGMHAASRLGFSVNFLAPVDSDMSPIAELYRVAPEVWITHCRQRFGADVELVEGYGMREFTLLVRRR
jgi:SAM-dependent methyltransferase